MKINSLLMLAVVVVGCGAPLPAPCGASYVDSSLTSVTLAQDCQEAKRDSAGVCLTGFACTELCTQTSMQLSFVSHELMAATVEIKAVRLIDPVNGKVLSNLAWRDPQSWSVEKYVAWDQQLAPSVELKATYKLSAPTYGDQSGARLYEKTYKVEVDLEIDGQLRTLSVDAQREPEVVT